ncbi:MAG: C39 family peptidase [Elusimicrobiaceae bacterium]|nr:C39 family peptidase [Elusimicrobiaceae bacterium]
MPTKIFKQANILPAYTLFLTPSDFKVLKINKDLQVLVSKPIKTPFEFDTLVPSINIIYKSKDAAVLVQCAVKTEQGWSKFYKLFYLSKNYKKTFSNLKDNFINRKADTVLPCTKATAFKLQITLLGKAKINLITAALTNKNIKHNSELSLESLGVTNIELPIKPLSQKEYKIKSLRNEICSPTSLTMALNYFGKKVALDDTIKGVFDNGAKIYGTWPFNTAFSGELGLKCCVTRCVSLAQAEAEIYQARPLIISIEFKNGELKNAPVKQTEGHLIILIGLDENGDFIAIDPAAKTAKTARRIYSRKDLAKVWLKNKRGLAYAFAYEK